MKRLFVWVLVVAMALAARSALAGTMYTVRESDNVLQKIDTNTLQFTDIGPLGIAFDFGDLAWDSSTGTLYMIGGRPSQALYTVDVNTGAATLVGNHNVVDLFALGYDPSNNVLYGAAFVANQPLYTMNRSNGAAQPGPAVAPRLGGMTYNSQDGVLIGISDGAGDLFSINPQTGQTTLLLDGPFTNNSGLAYDPEQHVLWDIDWSGNLHKYDIANGYARTTPLSGLGEHDGLAFVTEGGRCAYRITKSKGKGGCQTCPPRGDTIRTQNACRELTDCAKKLKTTLACPNGPGTCKIKGKRSDCS